MGVIFVLDYSKVWYASYGSNLSRKRFMCYIEGGTPEGSSRKEDGCRDNTPPEKDKPIKIPFPLYFKCISNKWNGGGVAFIGLEIEPKNRTLGRMYLITRQQFIDIVKQENNMKELPDINFEKGHKEGSQKLFNKPYGEIICLGEESRHPIYTFTSPSCEEGIIYSPPTDGYLKTIVEGLQQTYNLSNEQIAEYLIKKKGVSGFLSKEKIISIIVNC